CPRYRRKAPARQRPGAFQPPPRPRWPPLTPGPAAPPQPQPPPRPDASNYPSQPPASRQMLLAARETLDEPGSTWPGGALRENRNSPPLRADYETNLTRSSRSEADPLSIRRGTSGGLFT